MSECVCVFLCLAGLCVPESVYACECTCSKEEPVPAGLCVFLLATWLFVSVCPQQEDCVWFTMFLVSLVIGVCYFPVCLSVMTSLGQMEPVEGTETQGDAWLARASHQPHSCRYTYVQTHPCTHIALHCMHPNKIHKKATEIPFTYDHLEKTTSEQGY